MFGRRILAAAAFVAAASALVAAASAQLTITNPSSTSWWVSGSTNTLAWTCNTSPYSEYTVVLSNSDTTILAAPLALIASVPNYDCSFSVNQQQSTQAASTTWTISLANNLNISDIYASAPFEIKAAGSSYPVSSAAASGTATSAGASASSTSTSKSSAASVNYIPVGMSMAAALVLGLVVA